MSTRPSGYSNSPSFLTLVLMARTRVRGPILPISIRSAIITFPVKERVGVTPRLSPTVPPAEMTSKKRGKKAVFDSIFIMSRIKELVIRMDINVRAVAFTTKGAGIVLSKMETVFLPLRVDFIEFIKMAKVVVLTPPAVEPGEPPINIIRQKP